MNFLREPQALAALVIRLCQNLRWILPKQKCRAFGAARRTQKVAQIEKVYVINLDRELERWRRIEQELKHIVDSSGTALFDLAERNAAVDARAFPEDPPKDCDVDPFYSLEDQLFVEPQPQALPTQFELDAPIRMTRPEIAVARSHINAWRQVAAGNHAYVLILEDDAWFHPLFASQMDQAWTELAPDIDGSFDVLYVSYVEVKHGAPKTQVSSHVFQPKRGLWHLSGYVLSRKGAQKLLRLLPCRGPVDLWINHQFAQLDVRATRRSLVNQRRDAKSTNSYSILPALSTIGAINSERASLFNSRPTEQPVFAFGPTGSGHSSLAMALSMLGYRCCSDLQTLPAAELARLLDGRVDRVFGAYVNIGCLGARISELRSRYPHAKFILTAAASITAHATCETITRDLNGADVVVIDSAAANPWKALCEHLRCAPPSCSFPRLEEVGQRVVVGEANETRNLVSKNPRRDKSPWVIEPRPWWQGIRSDQTKDINAGVRTVITIRDDLARLDERRWTLRSDTFTDNLALFRPPNAKFNPGGGISLFVRPESLGVRAYSAASICSRDQYLFGRFEAMIQASGVPGVVTGFFLHRNSPRQEIDFEIAGNRPDRLLTNVFYNPGPEGANFDYGYRGTPSFIELGFDASKSLHCFAIEWSACEIRWLIDDRLIHQRVMWNPTPIPQLPMKLHVNCWPSRSTQLAGRINDRALPAYAIVNSIGVTATCVASKSSPELSS